MADPVTSIPGVREGDLSTMLRSLELTITRKLDGILHGQFQGLTPGHGSEPGESRPYIVGDDVRRIDWNVTARTRELYVRDQIADRDLEGWLVVDAAASMAFGTDRAEKRAIALGAAAAVGFLTSRMKNKLGAVIGAGPDRRAFPPRAGRDHLRAMLSVIGSTVGAEGAGRTDLGALLDDVAGRCRRRGFVCVIADFLPPPDTWSRQLGALAQRHDVLAIEIVDRRELDLPAVGTLSFVDPATGLRRDVHITDKVRARYAEAAAAQRAAIRTAILATGARHLQLRTDDDWLIAVIRHVREMRRRPVMLPAGAAS